MNTLIEALGYSFIQRAILAAVLASIACGVVGSLVVTKRASSISGGLAHAAFGGVGIGYFFGFNPLVGALLFGLISGLIIGLAYLKHREGLDNLIALVWAVGMALGVILIAITPGYAPDLNSYLFGNILFVSNDYVLLVGLLDLIVVLAFASLFKHFQAMAFDEEFYAIKGLPLTPMFLIFIGLVSLVVVVLIKIVGAIMLISLLTAPALVARHWSDRLLQMMIFATAVSTICTIGGLFLSFTLSELGSFNLPTGPLIIILAALIYLASLTAKKFYRVG